MMGNRDNVQDRGSWTYLGNYTYKLISNISADHERIDITLDMKERSFSSGMRYSSTVNLTRNDTSSSPETERWFDPAVTQKIVYAKV
jgi:hypothetical protein